MFFFVFINFFCGTARPAGGSGQKTPDRPQSVGQFQQNGEQQGAYGEKIAAAPQQSSHAVIDAHLPVVPEQGKQEQPGDGPQPEQQVQQKGQPFQAEGAAEGAHHVVDQAQGRPQQEALSKGGGLTQNIHVHIQRSNREKKPPRTGPASSS